MDERPPLEPEGDDLQVVDVVKRAGRFSREFLATLIGLVTTAFGVATAEPFGATRWRFGV